MVRACVFAAGLALVSGSAMAEVSLSIDPNNISPLHLSLTGDDGVYNGFAGARDVAPAGTDWGFVSGVSSRVGVWHDEDWTSGGDVDLSATGTSGLESVGQEIYLSKRTRNRSGFVWTGFQIVLTNAGGNITLIDPVDPTGSGFSTVNVVGDGTPTITITYSGGSVALNSFANFEVNFEIPSGPSWQYTHIQTPVPTPGALALLGVGGLVAGRRRR